MKLGNETGSIINHLMSRSTNEPVVGKGATILNWSDRYAYFVNKVSADGKEIEIERAKPIRTDANGMSDAQNYRYERILDQNPEVIKFRYGKWRKVYMDTTGKTKYSPINIIFGVMREYYDFSF